MPRKTNSRLPIGAASLALVAFAAGCTVNEPLSVRGETASPAYRYETLSQYTDSARNGDETLVILTLSGGGARAAALGFGVMERLNADRIRPHGGSARSVLDELDLISANSGGSFLAAYYAVYREAMFRADATGQAAFERDFLKRPLTTELIAAALLELRRITEGRVSRTEVAAQHFGRTLYAGATYADLVRRGRPFLVVNAHDTTKRARFEFTQAQFDLICSDLGGVPIAHAVMASSAVHGIFTPVKLRNHPASFCPPEPIWVASAFRGEGDVGDLVDSPEARRDRARLARWYREKLPDGRVAANGTAFFVHLADAAAVDNLGLRAPLLALASRDSEMGLKRLIESGRVKSVVLIAVNAATPPNAMRDADPDGPSAMETMRDAADGLIRAVSQQTLRETRHVFAQLRAAGLARGGLPNVYGPIVVDFDVVSDARLRDCLKRVPTAFDLPHESIDALRAAGRAILAESPEYRRFLSDHGGAETVLAAIPGAVRACAERRQAGRR